MIYPAGNDFHLTRRETLRTVGSAVVLPVGSGNGGPTGAVSEFGKNLTLSIDGPA